MVQWRQIFTSRDGFPFTCDEIRVFWRRSHWHVCIQYKSPRQDRDDPWAYGSLGVHITPAPPEGLASALERALAVIERKRRRAGVAWNDPVIYCDGYNPPEVLDAARTAAQRLGWPHVTTPRR